MSRAVVTRLKMVWTRAICQGAMLWETNSQRKMAYSSSKPERQRMGPMNLMDT